MRADLGTPDLLALVSAVSLAAVDDDGTQADRLLGITIDGLRPRA
ncbi:hypothetical protein AB0G71_25630 [Streptomyces sp. NPDC020403]